MVLQADNNTAAQPRRDDAASKLDELVSSKAAAREREANKAAAAIEAHASRSPKPSPKPSPSVSPRPVPKPSAVPDTKSSQSSDTRGFVPRGGDKHKHAASHMPQAHTNRVSTNLMVDDNVSGDRLFFEKVTRTKGGVYDKMLNIFGTKQANRLTAEEIRLVLAPEVEGEAFRAGGRHGFDKRYRDPIRIMMGQERGMPARSK